MAILDPLVQKAWDGKMLDHTQQLKLLRKGERERSILLERCPNLFPDVIEVALKNHFREAADRILARVDLHLSENAEKLILEKGVDILRAAGTRLRSGGALKQALETCIKTLETDDDFELKFKAQAGLQSLAENPHLERALQHALLDFCDKEPGWGWKIKCTLASKTLDSQVAARISFDNDTSVLSCLASGRLDPENTWAARFISSRRPLRFDMALKKAGADPLVGAMLAPNWDGDLVSLMEAATVLGPGA